jgi:hypothetical protein
MDDFNSESEDSDYTSYWRDWVSRISHFFTTRYTLGWLMGRREVPVEMKVMVSRSLNGLLLIPFMLQVGTRDG